MNKVKHVIERLQQLDPNEEIMVAWWSKEFVTEFLLLNEYDDEGNIIENISDKAWANAVDIFTTAELSWGQDVLDIVTDSIERNEK